VGKRRVTVVVLYTHALLGEGVQKILAAEDGFDVVAVTSGDIEAAERALATEPDVVVFERNSPLQAIDLLKFTPNALLIDVGMDAGPTWTYHREQISAQPEGILEAIRSLRRTEPAERTDREEVALEAIPNALGAPS
jgi:DNA-binding NarL/FixJ family response regulator